MITGTCQQDFERVTLFQSEILKYTPCLGVWLSSRDYSGEGKIYCYANFFCYANFSFVFKSIFFGGENCLRGKPGVSRTMYQNTEMSSSIDR